MRTIALTSAGLFTLASAGFFAPAVQAVAAPLNDLCVNPQTDEIYASEFCRCQIERYLDEEPKIVGSAAPEFVCPPDATGSGVSSFVIVPSNGGGGGNGPGGNGNGNWPGWGYGDPNHDHTGPPPVSLTGAPGQSDEGPPGLREFNED